MTALRYLGSVLLVTCFIGCGKNQNVTESMGGTIVNGHTCHYHIKNGKISYLVIFSQNIHQSNLTHTVSTLGDKDAKYSFEIDHKNKFTLTYNLSDQITINDIEYNLNKGSIILFDITSNSCDQIDLIAQDELHNSIADDITIINMVNRISKDNKAIDNFIRK